MPSVCNRDPTHPGDMFEEWNGCHIMRGIVFAVINQGGSDDLRQTRDTSPTSQRALGSKPALSIPDRVRLTYTSRDCDDVQMRGGKRTWSGRRWCRR